MTVREDGEDSGFTLVELLLAVSILGVILGSITSALLVFFDGAVYTRDRDDHSAGASLAATYLNRDLASASSASAGGSVCSGVSNVISLTWSEWTASSSSPTPAAGVTYTSAYTLQPDAASSSFRLERWHCVGAAAPIRTALLTDLAAATELVQGTSADCPGTATSVVLNLRSYGDDTTADYSLAGCLNGRMG